MNWQRKHLMHAAAAAFLVTSTMTAGAVVMAQSDPATPEVTPEAAQATRPFLGVRLELIDGAVTVTAVQPGSPAEAAGLQAGDVLTTINDTAVESLQDAANTIGALAVGDTVTVGYTRAGEAATTDAVLAGLVAETLNGNQGMGSGGVFGFGGEDDDEDGEGPDGGFGMRLDIRGDVDLSYNADAGTWTVNTISEDSPLAQAGLAAGDVITAVNGSAVTPEALMQLLPTLTPDSTITLTIERDGSSQDIEVPFEGLASLLMGAMGGGAFGMPGIQMFQVPMPGGQNGPQGQFVPGQQGQGQQGHGWGGRGDRQGQGGQLGVAYINLDEQAAADNNVSLTEGALVMEVLEGSAAATAGVQAGDVITAVNGEAVDAEHTLRDRMVAYEPDDVVTLSISRGGETLELDVTLTAPEMAALPEMGFNQSQAMPFGFEMQIPVAPGTGLPVPASPNV